MGPSDFTSQAPVPRLGSRMKPSLTFDQILAMSPASVAIQAAMEALRAKDRTANKPQEEQSDAKRRKIGEGPSLKHSFDGTSSSPTATFKSFPRPAAPVTTTTLPTPVSSSFARESVSSPPNTAKLQPPYFQALAHLSGGVNVYTPASHLGNAVPATFHNPPPPTLQRTPHVAPKPAEGLENRTPKDASPKPPPATTNTLISQKPAPITKRKLADITESREIETVTPRNTTQGQQDDNTPTTRRKSARTSIPSEKAIQAGLVIEAEDKRLETRRQSTRTPRTEPPKLKNNSAAKPVKPIKSLAQSTEKPTEKPSASNMQNIQEYELKFPAAIYDHEEDDSDCDIIPARPKRTRNPAINHTPLKQPEVPGPAGGIEAVPPMKAITPAEKNTSMKASGKATATPKAASEVNQSLPQKRPSEVLPTGPDSGRRRASRLNDQVSTSKPAATSSSKSSKTTTKTPAKPITSTKEKTNAAENPLLSNSIPGTKNPPLPSTTPATAPSKKPRKSHPETPVSAPASSRSTRSTRNLIEVPETPAVASTPTGTGRNSSSRNSSSKQNQPLRRKEVPETPQTEPLVVIPKKPRTRTRTSLPTSEITATEPPIAAVDIPEVPVIKKTRNSLSSASKTAGVAEKVVTPKMKMKMEMKTKRTSTSRKSTVKIVLPSSDKKPSNSKVPIKAPTSASASTPVENPNPPITPKPPNPLSILPLPLSPSKESLKFSTTGGADRLYKIPPQILAVTGSVTDNRGRRVSGRRYTAGTEVLEALRLVGEEARERGVSTGGEGITGGKKEQGGRRRDGVGKVKVKVGAKAMTKGKMVMKGKEKEKEQQQQQQQQKDIRYDFSDED